MRAHFPGNVIFNVCIIFLKLHNKTKLSQVWKYSLEITVSPRHSALYDIQVMSSFSLIYPHLCQSTYPYHGYLIITYIDSIHLLLARLLTVLLIHCIHLLFAVACFSNISIHTELWFHWYLDSFLWSHSLPEPSATQRKTSDAHIGNYRYQRLSRALIFSLIQKENRIGTLFRFCKRSEVHKLANPEHSTTFYLITLVY